MCWCRRRYWNHCRCGAAADTANHSSDHRHMLMQVIISETIQVVNSLEETVK